jgi:hypothetical protein
MIGAALVTGILWSGAMKALYRFRWGFWFGMYRRRRLLIVWLHDQPWW